MYPEHEEIKEAEISHRYFKALKLAGAYALVVVEDQGRNGLYLCFLQVSKFQVRGVYLFPVDMA